MFVWQRHSSESLDVPHYSKLLEFLNLRAQASEASNPDSSKHEVRHGKKNLSGSAKSVTSFAASVATNCVV